MAAPVATSLRSVGPGAGYSQVERVPRPGGFAVARASDPVAGAPFARRLATHWSRSCPIGGYAGEAARFADPPGASITSRDTANGRRVRGKVRVGVIIAGFVMILAVALLAAFSDNARIAAGLACCIAGLALWRAAALQERDRARRARPADAATVIRELTSRL